MINCLLVNVLIYNICVDFPGSWEWRVYIMVLKRVESHRLLIFHLHVHRTAEIYNIRIKNNSFGYAQIREKMQHTTLYIWNLSTTVVVDVQLVKKRRFPIICNFYYCIFIVISASCIVKTQFQSLFPEIVDFYNLNHLTI